MHFCERLFLREVNEGTPLWTDGWDGMRQIQVIDRAYESAGMPVRGLNISD
jgi:predicted dehydrogenase